MTLRHVLHAATKFCKKHVQKTKEKVINRKSDVLDVEYRIHFTRETRFVEKTFPLNLHQKKVALEKKHGIRVSCLWDLYYFDPVMMTQLIHGTIYFLVQQNM